MRVLLINSVCGRQSTGRIVSDLQSILCEYGHDCRVAYGEKDSISRENDYHIGNEISRYFHAGLTRCLDATGFGSFFSTNRFLNWVKDYNPDVIHLHNVHGYYINIPLLFDYLHSCEKRIVWTLHDCWSFTGHSAYCDAIGCEQWRTGCCSCPNMREYPASIIDRSSYNWKRKKELFTGVPNLTLISPSEWLAGLVKESFLSEYPVNVIHNGVDLSRFFPSKSDFKKQMGIERLFMILGVAFPWNRMKGFSDYLTLARLLGDEYTIVMVGLSKKQMIGLPRNVIGIEKTNSAEELAYIYSAADLFVNLSYCENYPTVNLEAAACGTPIITYDTGGSRESALKYGGVVVKRGDIEAVANAIDCYRASRLSKQHTNIDRVTLDKRTALELTLKVYEEVDRD